MCNRKDEGGRCYAHLTQFVQNLDKREEQVIYDSAVQAGVPLDEVALREQTAAVIADCEKEKEDFKAEVAQKKATMMELHKTAQTELRRSLVTYDQERRGALISNPFAKPEAESKPEDHPGFAGYEDTVSYVEIRKFANAVTLEKRKAEEDLIEARQEYVKRQEKEAARNNIELRSLRRKIFLLEAKEMLDIDSSGMESYRVEKRYEELLREEVDKGVPFHESDECKKMMERVNAVNAEFSSAQKHKEEAENSLIKHLHGNSAISHEDQASLSSTLKSLRVQPSDYQKLKGGHYARRFRDAKEDYIRTADAEPNWKTRTDKAVKDLKKNPPLQQESFAAYRENVYPTTPEAKEIKTQRDEAKKELVLTPTYRKNLRKSLDDRYYHGESVAKEREVLAKLDAAAEAKKAGKPGVKRNKQEESFDEDIAS